MLGLGISSTADMGWAASTKENVLLSVFQSRISADGGSVEDVPCLSLDLDLLLSESSSFTTGLLEFYPGAAAAYSLRQLRRSVSPAIRVRRSGDSLEQDIGFNSNGELDTNALLDFADGGDAWVAKWYDQSSNGNDAEQSTPGSQPQIVSSGSLITENGKPAVQFDGTDDSLDAGAVDVPTMAISVVASYNTTDGLKRPFAVRGVVLNDKDTFAQGSDFSLRYDGDFSTGTLTPSTGTQYLRFSQRSTSAQTDFVNSSSNVNDTKTLPNIEGTYTIGQACVLVEYFNGKVQEAIAWESDQSANRTGIEANINDYFGIYTPFTTGLLDDYLGAAAAYSLRRLSSTYTGDAITVRRASDNAEQDIGFDIEGNLNTAALASFCSGTDGYVKVWYDQSGNANDATQTTTANQPQIVSSGSVTTKNGLPTLNVNGTIGYLTSTAATDYSSGLLTAAVFSGYSYPLSVQSDFNNGFRHQVLTDRMRARFNTTNLEDYTSTSYYGDQVLQILTFDGTTGGNYVNDQKGVTGSVSVSNTSSMPKRIGSVSYLDSAYTGNIQEVIMFDSDQSANREAIRDNINTFYSIY